MDNGHTTALINGEGQFSVFAHCQGKDLIPTTTTSDSVCLCIQRQQDFFLVLRSLCISINARQAGRNLFRGIRTAHGTLREAQGKDVIHLRMRYTINICTFQSRVVSTKLYVKELVGIKDIFVGLSTLVVPVTRCQTVRLRSIRPGDCITLVNSQIPGSLGSDLCRPVLYLENLPCSQIHGGRDMVTILVRDRVFDRKGASIGLCLQAKNIFFTFVLYRLQECQGGCSFLINCYGKARRILWIITICDTQDNASVFHKENLFVLCVCPFTSQSSQIGRDRFTRQLQFIALRA